MFRARKGPSKQTKAFSRRWQKSNSKDASSKFKYFSKFLLFFCVHIWNEKDLRQRSGLNQRATRGRWDHNNDLDKENINPHEINHQRNRGHEKDAYEDKSSQNRSRYGNQHLGYENNFGYNENQSLGVDRNSASYNNLNNADNEKGSSRSSNERHRDNDNTPECYKQRDNFLNQSIRGGYGNNQRGIKH